jgi:tetratricopeptide (TPR) repeat protein
MRSGLKYLVFFCCFGLLSYSQNTKNISETISKLKQANIPDSSKVDLYLTLASEYISYKNDSSFYYLEKAEDLLKKSPSIEDDADAKYLRSMVYYTISEFDQAQWSLNQAIAVALAIDNKKLLSKAYNLMGAIQFNLGNYSEAIKQYNKKLEIAQSLGDTISIIETYYNISLINNAEGSYFKSLENNYAALGLSEKIKDSVSMMIVYEGLGISYSKIKDTKKAIINLKKALQLAIKYGKTYEEAGIWVDLGNVYQQNGEQEKALYYFKRGEETAKRNGDKLVESIAVSGKGVSLMRLGKYKEAIAIFNQANVIHKNIAYKKGVAENQLNIADCNIEMGNYKDAKSHILQSLAEAKDLGELQLEGNAYRSLSKVYEKLKDQDSAYYCFKRSVAVSDTIKSRTTLRKITEMESKIEKAEMEEKRLYAEKLSAAELEKQKQIRNIILMAAIIVLILLIISYRNYKQKQKASVQITEKKKMIEHRNKDILDSINYSKRLQDAVLMSKEEVMSVLPGSALVYIPKEIVSGDFYFIEKDTSGKTHLILAESNKHGVPGAFISIAANSILKQGIKEDPSSGPAEILAGLNNELKAFLKNRERDGINLAYCQMDTVNKKLLFSGANLPAWLLSSRSKPGLQLVAEKGPMKLYEMTNGMIPAGKTENIKFDQLEIEAELGDTLYLFTNGYISQLNHKKEELGKKAFAEILLNQENVSEKAIKDSFNAWKGPVEQTDDVCVLGIRL